MAPLPSSSGQSLSVLVVEDEILVRAVLADELREHGYGVIEASSTVEAGEVLESALAVDLVLTDVRTPGTVEGGAFLSALRAEHPELKVLVADTAPRRAAGAPAAAGQAEPYDFSVLLAEIRALIGSAPAGQ
jgi:CheY-like chemotaxis protein